MSEEKNFMGQYRRLETILRDRGYGSVLDYENTLQSEAGNDDYDRLKVCRIQRNFIQHHADGGFVQISPKQTAFIKGLADRLEAEFMHVKDVMVRQKPVTLDMTIKDVLSAVAKSKFGYVVITDKNGLFNGVIDDKEMLAIITKKGSLAGKLSTVVDDAFLKKSVSKHHIGAIEPELRADELYKGSYDMIIAIKDHKYRGIVK